MHSDNLNPWKHDHIFGQNRVRAGEKGMKIVIALTGSMMVVEILAGIVYGSIALLADGLHMATHMIALAINAFAYTYARKHAQDINYSFGTGKVNALGGFSGAVLLAFFSCLMAWESVIRLNQPVPISINQAIIVAVLGLVVNGICAYILGNNGGDHHDIHTDDDTHPHGHDHNLKSAYLHVITDALTSVLAIVALLAAKYFGALWVDPLMGIVGALLVARWSVGLLRATSFVLLDRQGPEQTRQAIKQSIEADGDSRVTDLHIWSIAPDVYAVIITVVAHARVSPNEYKARIPKNLGLAHISIEIHQYEEE